MRICNDVTRNNNCHLSEKQKLLHEIGNSHSTFSSTVLTESKDRPGFSTNVALYRFSATISFSLRKVTRSTKKTSPLPGNGLKLIEDPLNNTASVSEVAMGLSSTSKPL